MEALECGIRLTLLPVVEDGHEFGHPFRKNVLVFGTIFHDITNEFHLAQFLLLLAVSNKGRNIHHGRIFKHIVL